MKSTHAIEENLEKEVAQLVQQNAELLEALKLAYGVISMFVVGVKQDKLTGDIKAVRAAILKAKSSK